MVPKQPSLSPSLDVRDLDVRVGPASRPIHAVSGANFYIEAGETLALVGESGCGKSVLAQAVMGLLPAGQTRGQALIDGEDILRLDERERGSRRGRRVAMIFQDPMTALNPYLRIQNQLTEVMTVHQKVSGKAATTRAREVLLEVGLKDVDTILKSFPYELSGGMRQRVVIAMAVMTRPMLLLADEPTTALDVTVQKQVLEVLARLQQSSHAAMLFITHNLAVAASIANRVALMYAGQIVELGPTQAFFTAPRHPYARALLEATPDLDSDVEAPLGGLGGSVPDLGALGEGCAFAPRCTRSQPRCLLSRPTLVASSQLSACACFYPLVGSYGADLA